MSQLPSPDEGLVHFNWIIVYVVCVVLFMTYYANTQFYQIITIAKWLVNKGPFIYRAIQSKLKITSRSRSYHPNLERKYSKQ